MNEMFSKPLGKATVQEIHLELIRRTDFNAFRGEFIVASLLAHRDLWEAVLLDRLGFSRMGRLPAGGLVKLRDLSDNLWNADTLYILTPDAQSAQKFAKLIEAEDWGGEVIVRTDQQEIDDALGSGRETRAVIKIWWD